MGHELTKQDIQKMQEEIEYRKITVRKELLEHVKEARAHGDLSENFEYHAAKKEKNQNESRIRFLERMIKTAEIVSDESNEDEAGLNNLVTVQFIADKLQESYRIVTTMRGNSLKGYITNESPMGKAILGHRVGDIVTVNVNANIHYDIEIISIDKESSEDIALNKF